jgi:uncharacterized protein (DUF2062 family)
MRLHSLHLLMGCTLPQIVILMHSFFPMLPFIRLLLPLDFTSLLHPALISFLSCPLLLALLPMLLFFVLGLASLPFIAIRHHHQQLRLGHQQ